MVALAWEQGLGLGGGSGNKRQPFCEGYQNLVTDEMWKVRSIPRSWRIEEMGKLAGEAGLQPKTQERGTVRKRNGFSCIPATLSNAQAHRQTAVQLEQDSLSKDSFSLTCSTTVLGVSRPLKRTGT